MNTAVGASPSQRSELAKPIHGIIALFITAALSELVLGSLSQNQSSVAAVARAAIVFLTLYTLHQYSRLSLRRYHPNPTDLVTLSGIIVCSGVLIAFGNLLAESVADYVSKYDFVQAISSTDLLFAVPFASGALLIQAVLGLHFGLLFSLALSVVVGVYFHHEILFAPLCLVSSLTACLSLSRFRTRSAYIKAGLNIALISLPFAIASSVLNPDAHLQELIVRSAAVFVGGILCSFVAAGFTPVIEYLGGYVTDMRLIEMATLDHPLLKDLSIQAPGTWNHSMVIGMMVEAAASSIGANSVLARVGAYFHDIGKMKKPLYFVENQSGENRHEKLSTSMSALIIRSHVKDGIELAKQHKLPPALIDMIPQHHGTSVIEFFYRKAKKEAEEAGEDPDEVDVSLYSYPGPKPQTREAGILMLADGIEAAARTISEPSQDRIQGMVQKLINKVFASGQLNECELTLQDLHHIAKAFTRVLTSIHHQRIAYAEPAEKVNEKQAEEAQSQKSAAKSKANGGKAAASKDKAEQSEKVDPIKSAAAERAAKAEQESEEANGKSVEDSSGAGGGDETGDEEDSGSGSEEDLKRLGL